MFLYVESDRAWLLPPGAHTETREIQNAGRPTTDSKGIAPNPKPEKGFPCLWSKPGTKSRCPTGTETKDTQVEGGGQARAEYVSEMGKLLGKDSANSTGTAQVTLGPAGV